MPGAKSLQESLFDNSLQKSLFDELQYEELDEEQQELIDCIGFESYKKLILTYGGTTINIRVPASVCMNTRDRLIRKEFSGYNHKQLAKKYNLTEMSIRRIVNNSK